MPEPLSIRPVPAGDPAVAAIRHEVFVLGQGVSPEVERDGRDGDAVHVLAERAGAPVGTGRLLTEQTADGRPIGRVGRMAVLAPARDAGVGAAVLRALERVAAERGLTAIRLHAQRDVIGFYAGAGYRVVSDPFVEAGIEHVGMTKPLPLVRAGCDEDSAALIALIGACFAEYPGCVLDIDDEEPWLRAPAGAYAAAGGQMWVATLDGEIAGCIGLRPGGELKNLYVAAAARRHGLGARLVGLVEDAALAAGATRLQLWTDTRFTDAHRLYERRGYRRTGRTRDLLDRSATVEYEFVRDLGAPGGTRVAGQQGTVTATG